MTCDEYYQIHPPFEGKGDRCAVGSIEAGTAKAVALLGTSTTVFGTNTLPSFDQIERVTDYWFKVLSIYSLQAVTSSDSVCI